jgi:photosystem II stability/assembly factor-like uncharacterized protein
MTYRFIAGVALVITGLLAPAAAHPATRRPAASGLDTKVLEDLKFRYIGPEGNRVSSIAGVVGDAAVYYAGAASGGIFKTIDGGIHWQPIFDGQPVASIGALAVSPGDPNVVWAGTGEPFIRSNISIGWGVFKSTDAGKSWTKMGLESTGRIARVVVHPHDPDVVLVCALGHAYGPQPERGVFRTTDGGKSWTKVLFVDESTGCSDLVMDPNNPRILFAGMWQLEIHTWGRESGGPGSGLYRSTDLGATWKAVEGEGLPKKPHGKVGLAMSRANSSRVYALIETGGGMTWRGQETESGRLCRSDDGGAKWTLVSSDQDVAGRTHYYNRMAAEPDNPDEAYFLTAAWAKTVDGGKTIFEPPIAETAAGDHHDIWIDPGNGNRIAVAHDAGVSISTNRGHSWRRVQLPVAQIYHVTVDDRIPYYVYGNRQDGPSTRGPSNSKLGNPEGFPGIARGLWYTVGGGESGWATPDPGDPDVVWSSASGTGSVGGIVTRCDLRTNTSRTVEVWPLATTGWPAVDLKYRFLWTFPLTISPHDHNKVYVGSQYVHQTTDGGNSWQVISPDLTLNDKSHQQISGGLTPDNIGVEYADVVFAIAESPLQAGLLWAGTNDGLVQVTEDGGKHWTNVTRNLPGLPPLGTVSHIEPSRFDARTAYVVVDLHQVNNRDPYVFKTTDLGKTWKKITDGLPRTPLSYGHALREDPARRGLLYLGLENGLYVSFDDGGKWQPLQNNLPAAPVYGIAVQPRFGDLVIATYGRGFWILDDLTPVRLLSAESLDKDAELLPPRAAYRFRRVEAPFTPDDDPVDGFNPPDGAPVNYFLKNTVKQKDKETGKEEEQVTFTVTDAGGKVVRTFKGPGKAGFHRVFWDLKFDKTKEARLRTSPLQASYMKIGLEGLAAPGVGRFELLAPPGTYAIKLKVGDHELSQPVTVLKDPGAGGSDADLAAQSGLATALLDDLNKVVEAINTAETVRGQLAFLRSLLPVDDDSRKDVRDAAEALDKKVVAVEENLFQVRVTGRGQDQLRFPGKLAEQVLYLANQVTNSDYAPTRSQREVQQLLRDQTKKVAQQWDELAAKDLVEFNAMLAQRHLTGIVANPAGEGKGKK